MGGLVFPLTALALVLGIIGLAALFSSSVQRYAAPLFIAVVVVLAVVVIIHFG